MNRLETAIAAALAKDPQMSETQAQRARRLAEEAARMPVQAASAPERGQTAKDGTQSVVSKAYSLTLPYPPTANNSKYIGKDGKLHKSKQAREYTDDVQKIATVFCRQGPLCGPLVVTMRAFRPRRRGDLFNLEKVCMDALKGYAFHDDDQIVEGHQFRHDDPANPRIEIEVDEKEKAS